MKFSCSVSFYYFLVLIISCNNSTESIKKVSHGVGNASNNVTSNTDTAFENYIADTIFSLREVQQENRQLDLLTKQKKGIAMLIDKSPDNKGEYEIKVGYNGAERFETYHIFYFDSISKQISIMDPASGDKISLDKWRTKKL